MGRIASLALAVLALGGGLSSAALAQASEPTAIDAIHFQLEPKKVVEEPVAVESTEAVEEVSGGGAEAESAAPVAADVAEAAPTDHQASNLPTSQETMQFANWVIATRDNGALPFIIIDKAAASVVVFDPAGQLLGATPALLGIAHGDDSTPGVGDKELSSMGPAEKTTPAGRFVAQIGPAKGNQTVLWVEFATAVALHPVVTTNKKERRLERLQSPTPEDNRITFGCINVPVPFFAELVKPVFSDAGGLVYILPERKFLIEVFPAFEMFAPLEERTAALAPNGD